MKAKFYTIRVHKIASRCFVLSIYCPAGLYIFGGTGVYKTEGNAKRWAKYWAGKLSFEFIKYEEKK